MYRNLFARDPFAELERLQREMSAAFDLSPGIRGHARSGYPALNVGSTPQSVEVYAFAPGIDPQRIEVHLERGVLTLSGERADLRPAASDGRSTLHVNERFAGRFRRVVSLPDDIDAAAVTASYRDGVLRVSIPRKAASQPRRIEVQ